MADFKFKLKHGLKIGKDTLFDVVMKDHLTAQELLDASEAAEKLVVVGDGDQAKPEFVISPTVMSAESLCRQIKQLGNLQGPLSRHTLGLLHEEDLSLCNRAASKIESLKVSQAVAQRGRTEPPAPGGE